MAKTTETERAAGGPLHILHVVRQYRPSIGGMESYVEEMVRRQSERHAITVLTLDRLFDGRERLPSTEVTDDATIVRVPYKGGKHLFFPAVPRKLLAKADIIHVHCTDQLFDVVSALARFTSAPLFVTTHGLYFHTDTLRRVKEIYLRTITRLSLSRATKIYACSGNDQRLLGNVGIKSTFFPNPIVPLATDLTSYGTDLLYIGRLSPNKRVDRLIDFAAALKSKGQSFQLHLVGADQDGLGEGLRAQSKALGLQDDVKFHGFVTAQQLEEICKQSGYIVSASSYEGFGLSMVEGMSVGLMPVMHPNAAFEEIKTRSDCGLLVDFDRSEEAAGAFLSWREQITPEDREAARRFALAQSWDEADQITERDYFNALGLEQATDHAGKGLIKGRDLASV